jgi:hypothetical protein
MMEAKADRGRSRRGDASGGQFAVVATLIAAAIGAIVGLTGQGLAYLQAKQSLEQSSKQHLQDIRREAYGGIIDSWSDTRQKYLAFGDHAMEDSEFVHSRPVFDKISDVYRALAARESRVYIVATPNVANSVRQVDRIFEKWRQELFRSPLGFYTEEVQLSLNKELLDKIDQFEKEANRNLTQ